MPKEILHLVREEAVNALFRNPANRSFSEFELGTYFLFSAEPQNAGRRQEAISIEEILCLIYLCEINNRLPALGFKFWSDCFNAFPKLRDYSSFMQRAESACCPALTANCPDQSAYCPNPADAAVPFGFTRELIVMDGCGIPVKDLCKCLLLMKKELPAIDRHASAELFRLFPVLQQLQEDEHD